MSNTMDIVENIIAEELKIPVSEVHALLNVSEDVKRLADAKIALNRLMRANGIISKMYAAVKSQISRKDALEKAIKKNLLDRIHVYRTQVKEGRYDLSKKDATMFIYNTLIALPNLDNISETLREYHKRHGNSAPEFTTEAMDSICSRDILNLTNTALNKLVDELAYTQQKEDMDKLESRHIAISKICDGIQREIFCMRELVSILVAEDRLLHMSQRINRSEQFNNTEMENT